ncbi:translocon-associated protein subunit beta-like [Limanda limanda]|uniref:translocon-associated protein subunit beta-like n=1 Tax=Limanda limanda TaxID=27771 RepID=UPI0029C8C308|nr:translocon-associated protein subunit beta-like [Limanda limanda]
MSVLLLTFKVNERRRAFTSHPVLFPEADPRPAPPRPRQVFSNKFIDVNKELLCQRGFHPSESHSGKLFFPHLRLEDKQTVRKMLHLIGVLALVSLVSSEEGARLLASKSLLNRYAVEGRDLCLQYNIYNVGSSVALEVELSDDSFPPEDFGIVSGMLNVKWDRIAPASNVSHTVVLRPLKAGYFNFTSASVRYLAQEGGQVVVGFTSAPGQGGILAEREFDRRFSPHYLDWAAFGVMTLPSIGIPLLLWYSSKRKYDSPKAKKN